MKIKGHTEIQLTNVKTGEVKTYHDDNMMTNGLAEFMKNHGMLCGTPFTDAVKNDLITTLLGGILLFDTALTESASNTRLTDGVKMTANACHGITHTGDPTELGSYDSNESGWQNAAHTVYRHVFTWTTSQGNGSIACACLTSKAHGFVGEGNSTSKDRTTDGNYNHSTYSNESYIDPIKTPFMVLDNEIYYFTLDTTDDTLTISKAHMCDDECDMRDTLNAGLQEPEEVLVVQNPTSTPFNSIEFVCARILTNSVVISMKSNGRILVLTFPTDFASLTSYVDVTTSATSLSGFGGMAFLTADATALVVRASNGKIYKIDLSNLANVVEIPNYASFDSTNHAELYCTGKRHILGDSVYDETLGAIYPLNCGTTDISKFNAAYKDDNSLFVRSSPTRGNDNNTSAGRRNDYLATINNLSSPVTKDSTQTMKVIYTLTFVS